MDHERFEDLKEAYVLNALSEAERREFEEYLAQHPERQAEIAELSGIAGLLALSPAEHDPPQELRRSIMNAVRSEARSPQPPRRSLVEYLRAVIGVRRLALGTAVIVLVGLLSWNAVLQREIQDLQNRNSNLLGQNQSLQGQVAHLKAYKMQTAGIAKDASAEVIRTKNGRLIVAVQNLPRTPRNKTYQLWTIKDNKPRPAGLFEPSGNVVAAPVKNFVSGTEVVAVTVEPAKGSRKPTTKPILTAKLRTTKG